MLNLIIAAEGCRGCRLCVEVCPTDALEFDTGDNKARVKEAQDCIGCLSCTHICPANVIDHEGIHLVQNFYRELDYSKKLRKFL